MDDSEDAVSGTRGKQIDGRRLYGIDKLSQNLIEQASMAQASHISAQHEIASALPKALPLEPTQRLGFSGVDSVNRVRAVCLSNARY